MSSLPADHRPSTFQVSSIARPSGSAARATTVAVPATATARAAANDDVAAAPNDLRNPLWIIAIGMAFFFGITAAVIALG
jgi:hypothetical protein